MPSRRCIARVLRTGVLLPVLIPALVIADDAGEPAAIEDFYISITADDLCLCGEGFGGIYGCIDEAVSREARSVVVSASSAATTEVVQELINAVHARGFARVGVLTLDESDAR